MVYLFASIVLSSYLILFFKLLDRLKIDSFQVIVFNYITCVITGSFVNGHFPVNRLTAGEPWFVWGLGMGLMFISLFNLIAYTARNIGVAVASVANKLSLVIPFLFSLFLYGETASFVQYGGIILALLAVVLSSYPDRTGESERTGRHRQLIILVPLLLFLGSGLLDTMIKYVEHRFLDGNNNNDYLITTFLTAAVTGLVLLTAGVLSGRIKFEKRSVIAGIILGIPNYFSIWALIRTLERFPAKSGTIIPVNNMGIVLFSAVAAWLLFKEKLSRVNWIGIFLSLLAISMIAMGGSEL